jgi:hypothetical protein
VVDKLFDAFFGCWHGNYSFPITTRSARRNAAAALTGTYVVCLECGKEMPYDWEDMKVIDTQADQRQYAQSIARHAA